LISGDLKTVDNLKIVLTLAFDDDEIGFAVALIWHCWLEETTAFSDTLLSELYHYLVVRMKLFAVRQSFKKTVHYY